MTPYSFCPFKTFIASTACLIGFPPRMRTPSISNANAYWSVKFVCGGVVGGVICPSAIFSLSRRCFAISIAAAVSWASLGFIICSGGTTTDGPRANSSKVVLIDESRRTPGFVGGERRVWSAMINDFRVVLATDRSLVGDVLEIKEELDI